MVASTTFWAPREIAEAQLSDRATGHDVGSTVEQKAFTCPQNVEYKPSY